MYTIMAFKMEENMKKFIALVMISLLTLTTFTGCSTTGTKQTTSVATTVGATTTTASTTPAASTAGTQELKKIVVGASITPHAEILAQVKKCSKSRDMIL
jgi:ABC-type metal ion transport system substrate-binding protein